MDTKTRRYICFLHETHFGPRDTYKLKVRGQKHIFHLNGNKKKAVVSKLISDKIDFKDFYKRQGRTLHNDQGISPIRYNNYKYICTQHNSTSTHKANANDNSRENLQEYNKSWGRVFSNLLTPIDRLSRQKINKETQVQNDTLGMQDLIDIYRVCHVKMIDFSFF